jgi:hypothetical protein
MTRAKKRADDLSQIKGIGPVRQHWLRESLGVYTFRELSAWSAAEIEARLRAEGEIVSLKEIARWIAQARKLAPEAEPSPERSTHAESRESAHAGPAAAPGKWKPFASFIVEFQSRTDADGEEALQTSVHHIEADRGMTWPGIETVQHCAWMRAQLGEQARLPRSETGVAPVAEAGAVRPLARPAPTARVEIDQVRIFQPPEAPQPTGIACAGVPFGAPIRGGESFALEASYHVLRPDGPGSAREPVRCTARFLVRDFHSGAHTDLGNAPPDRPEGAAPEAFVARLPRASLGAGLYRLRVLVTPASGAGPGYAEIPILQSV